MEFAGYTHKGNVREINEDSLYIPQNWQSAEPPHFMAVADGMGGHNAGEVASAMAIRSMVNLLTTKDAQDDIVKNPVGVLRKVMMVTNDKVYMLGKQSAKFAGMGTTMTAALCYEQDVLVAHLGDSRAYLVHSDGSFLRITHDHTLVQDYIDHNLLTPEQAAMDPRRNILTRALGTELGQTPDMFDTPWQQGDTLVICSDGLTAYLNDEELCALASEATQALHCANMLGNIALERGGIDNISVCVAMHRGGQAE